MQERYRGVGLSPTHL